MNRRGFLGALLAAPVAGAAVVLAAKKPDPHTIYFDKPFRRVGAAPELAMGYGTWIGQWDLARYKKTDIWITRHCGKLHENLVQSASRDIYRQAYEIMQRTPGWAIE